MSRPQGEQSGGSSLNVGDALWPAYARELIVLQRVLQRLPFASLSTSAYAQHASPTVKTSC